MKYLPLSKEEKEHYIQYIGHNSIEDLFRTIPVEVKVQTDKSLEPPKSEIEIRSTFDKIESQNQFNKNTISFLGGIAHNHYIPSIIDPLISRGEFLTAYTPYQPEISQGTLQAIYEYQSMAASLMGVDVSNASLYDGSTSMVEAVLMSMRINGKDKVILAGEINVQYVETLRTYLNQAESQIVQAPSDPTTGQVDLKQLSSKIQSDVSCVVVQSPNAIGIIEKIKDIKSILNQTEILLVVVVTEAISLGLLKSPGSLGADIVCGEAQSFGIPILFGGPYLGMLGSSMKHIRNFPGRLIGETKDGDGNRGFVITLSTREQHIRRDKATSNICTNQGLMSLRAGIYLSVMGKQGLREVAIQCAKATELARTEVAKIKGIRLIGNASVFNEFVFEVPMNSKDFFDKCFQTGNLFVGNQIGQNRILSSFDETMTQATIDHWSKTIQTVVK